MLSWAEFEKILYRRPMLVPLSLSFTPCLHTLHIFIQRTKIQSNLTYTVHKEGAFRGVVRLSTVASLLNFSDGLNKNSELGCCGVLLYRPFPPPTSAEAQLR